MEAIIIARDKQAWLRTAALVAGLGILVMALTVPIVEFYIFPKLVDFKNAVQTTRNIVNHTKLLSTAIFIHFITVICDVVVTWALYTFFTPVNKNLSLLTAWFRLVYTAFNIAALLNLIQILSFLKLTSNFTSVDSQLVPGYVLLNLNSFNLQWRFGLIFFGIYLFMLSCLIFKASYVPNFVGAFIVISGIGYLIDDLKYFFYPHFDTGFLWFTFFGELIFMFWLLIWGAKITIGEEFR